MHLLSTLLIVLLTGNLAFSSTYSKTLYKPEDYELLFENFIEDYDRSYIDENEKQLRYEIFKHSLEEINKLNSRNEHAVFGINMFTDYTKEELEMLNGFKNIGSAPKYNCTNVNYDKNTFIEADEDSFDWREQNAVTDVKDQGNCGSCWAFSITGNIEGQYAIKNKELVAFSEQQIVDCVRDEINQGCVSGSRPKALDGIIEMGGLMTEKDYPYVGMDTQCTFDKSKVKVQLKNCKVFNLNQDEEKLKSVLKTVGPLSIGITSGREVHLYTQGIITTACSKSIGVHHAVLLVGWGSENGVPYWIVKNSWGNKWGERGYFRLQRGINSCCLVKRDRPITTAVL